MLAKIDVFTVDVGWSVEEVTVRGADDLRNAILYFNESPDREACHVVCDELGIDENCNMWL